MVHRVHKDRLETQVLRVLRGLKVLVEKWVRQVSQVLWDLLEPQVRRALQEKWVFLVLQVLLANVNAKTVVV